MNKYFNSTTDRGRANVAKATYGSILLIYLYYRMKRSGQKKAQAAVLATPGPVPCLPVPCVPPAQPENESPSQALDEHDHGYCTPECKGGHDHAGQADEHKSSEHGNGGGGETNESERSSGNGHDAGQDVGGHDGHDLSQGGDSKSASQNPSDNQPVQ